MNWMLLLNHTHRERLCRYISRPAVSERRLAITSRGHVRYELKTPYTDGTTHVIFEPLDFMAKRAALVPKPRVNLTRYHGVLAPNSQHRLNVTPTRRGTKSRAVREGDDTQDAGSKKSADLAVNVHKEVTWAQRLKRVFNIDISICRRCGGAVKIIACIEDPLVIEKILNHMDAKSIALASANQLKEPRAPPQARLFD